MRCQNIYSKSAKGPANIQVADIDRQQEVTQVVNQVDNQSDEQDLQVWP